MFLEVARSRDCHISFSLSIGQDAAVELEVKDVEGLIVETANPDEELEDEDFEDDED